MKQITVLLIALAVIMLPVACCLNSHDFEVDGIYYNKNGDGTVSVTSKGSSFNEYIDEYTGIVVIPSTVTYSGTTFSVTSIGDWAFSGCKRLTTICIPISVKTIGNFAFYGCTGLTSVYIPNSVSSIGYYAFYGCSGLTSIIVDSENQIYDSRENCNAIIETASNKLLYGSNNTIIPNSVTSIGDQAFSSRSGLTSVSIPNSVTSIDEKAFYGCSGLTSVNISNSVETIENGVFSGCSGLTSVNIPNSVSSIGSEAFSGCSGLKSITIPNSVSSIGSEAFSGCSGLKYIKVDSENQKYDSRDNCNAIIETATNTLHTGCKNTIIPNSVSSIGDYAFKGCSGLTSITIPNSVSSIGDYAFTNCIYLTSVTIPSSVTSIGKNAFHGCRSLE